MLVVNTIGYDFSFKYDGKAGKGVVKIPFDGRPYNVPDDIPEFKELRKVMVVNDTVDESPVESKSTDVVTSNDGNYKDDINSFPQTTLEKINKEDAEKKPLSGVKIKKKKKRQILSKKIK